MKNKKWYLGFLGFMGFQGIPAVIGHDWIGASWFVWFIWFLYFIPFDSAQDKPGYGDKKPSDPNTGNDALMEKQEKEKNENLKKTLEYFDSHEKVSNNEIQNLLGVSDATATNYLSELEREGKISQVGDTGQSVFYVKK